MGGVRWKKLDAGGERTNNQTGSRMTCEPSRTDDTKQKMKESNCEK